MDKKTQQCLSCQNLSRRLKVIQADYDFEIKKINQDKSTQKALFELNNNKEIKKLQQKCLKQKQQRLKQNQLWMTKYDQLVQKQTIELAQYKLQKDKELQDFKKTKNQEVQAFKESVVTELQEKIKILKVEKQTIQVQLKQKQQKEIAEVKKSFEDKINDLIKKNEENLNKKCQQYEATILGIQSEKNVQENLHKKTKQESKDTQSRLNQQIYSLKKNIIELDEKIITLKTQIQQKCQQIQTLHVEIDKMQKDFCEKQQQHLKQYEEKYELQKKSMQKKIEQLFKKQLENCSKYEKALQKIEQHRQIQNQMYKANLSEIKGCVEQRPSRFEDVQQIIKLKQRLTKKQRQCESLSQELKYYRLELQNKEETYNRIFGPDSKNSESVMIKRKDLRMKRTGKSVTTVREILGSANINPNILAPLVGNLQKKLLPPKQNKIL